MSTLPVYSSFVISLGETFLCNIFANNAQVKSSWEKVPSS